MGDFPKPTLAAVLDHYQIEYRQHTHGWVFVSCPFHDENTPSCRVNIEIEAFKCFACGASGGDSIAFIMQRENCEFLEAVAIAADIPGEKVQVKTGRAMVDGRPEPLGRRAGAKPYVPRYRRKRNG